MLPFLFCRNVTWAPAFTVYGGTGHERRRSRDSPHAERRVDPSGFIWRDFTYICKYFHSFHQNFQVSSDNNDLMEDTTIKGGGKTTLLEGLTKRATKPSSSAKANSRVVALFPSCINVTLAIKQTYALLELLSKEMDGVLKCFH